MKTSFLTTLQRIVAALVDLILVSLVSLIVLSLTNEDIYLIVFCTLVLLFPFRDIFFLGRSIGKRLLRLVIINTDEKKCFEKKVPVGKMILRQVIFVFFGFVEVFVLLITGKTLGETEDDYNRMCAIAGFIYKSFAGFGRCHDPRLKTYAVCIEESFLRNTQYLDPEELTDDEFEERDNGLDIERAWCGVSLHGFLNIVEAPSREKAIAIAANDFNYDRRTLFAIEIKANA